MKVNKQPCWPNGKWWIWFLRVDDIGAASFSRRNNFRQLLRFLFYFVCLFVSLLFPDTLLLVLFYGIVHYLCGRIQVSHLVYFDNEFSQVEFLVSKRFCWEFSTFEFSRYTSSFYTNYICYYKLVFLLAQYTRITLFGIANLSKFDVLFGW